MYLIREFKSMLEGGKLDNIYMPADGEFVLRVQKGGKKQLRIVFPSLIYLAERTPPNPQNPPGLCSQLRKHLRGATFEAIEQLAMERIIKITCSRGETRYIVYIELFAKGNIIMEKDGVVEAASLFKRWSDRAIERKKPYQPPTLSRDPRELTLMSFESLYEKGDDPIAKWLARTFGLGGIYANEICLRAGIDGKKPTQDIDAPQREHLFAVMGNLTKENAEPQIVLKNGEPINITPFKLRYYDGYEQRSCTTLSQAYEELFADTIQERKFGAAASSHDKKIQQVERIKEQQVQQEKGLLRQIEQNTAAGEMIYAKYQPLQELLNLAKKAIAGDEKASEQLAVYQVKLNRKDKTVSVEINEDS